jgi:hypothetical protein
MAVIQETIQLVLRAWIAIEVLTPQITKDGGWNKVAAERGGRLRNRQTDAQDGPSLWRPPQDHELPPWPLYCLTHRRGAGAEGGRPQREHYAVHADAPGATRVVDWHRHILSETGSDRTTCRAAATGSFGNGTR